MRDMDWKDCVDFGYWMFQKIYCHKCGKVVSYSCHTQNELDTYIINSPVKFWCQECLIKELYLDSPKDIEEACEAPKRIYEEYKKKGFCKHGNGLGEYCCKDKLPIQRSWKFWK